MKKGMYYMDKRQIEDRAEKVLEAINYDFENDTYVDAVKLARFFGFSVYQDKSLQVSEDGSISVDHEDEKFIGNIVINEDRRFEFKRFVITHELAHYLLHYQNDNKFFKHRENIKGKNLEENDADYLAACLLMPAKSFKKQYNSLKNGKTEIGIIMELKKKFLVPEESISRRIEEVCL